MAAETKVIRYNDIGRCPKGSWLPGHYAKDGTCNCTRREAIEAELAALEADRQRLHREHRDVVARIRRIRRMQ